MSAPAGHAVEEAVTAQHFKRIADAHCHAHLDEKARERRQDLKARYMAIMSVSSKDWDRVAALAASDSRVLPCFGVHPWQAHMHIGSDNGAAATVGDVLRRPPRNGSEAITSQHLIQGWQSELEDRLRANEAAIVGECGLDRAARVPGTGAETDVDHQWDILRTHMRLANRYARPISLHCVKAYGQLQQGLEAYDPADCPPKIMLHSYGGSAELVSQFVRIGNNDDGNTEPVGRRLYFSFSAVLAERSIDKTKALIHAVPDDRLLIETDMESMVDMHDALVNIVRIVADAKGWTVDEAVNRTWDNFLRFYDGFLPS